MGAGLALPAPSLTVDFTPLLAQVRTYNLRTHDLLRGARVVLCLGSRAQISFLMGSVDAPELILGAATTEAEGLELVRTLQPDFLFTSDRLEGGCGIDLVVAIKRRHAATRTLLMICEQPQRARLQRAIEAGCDGVLLESNMGLGTGLAAIRTVCGGGIYLERELAELFRSEDPGAGAAAPAPQRLTARETEVLAKLVTGASNSEIAQQLVVSLDTVKSHISNLLSKLQARDRTHAAVIGLRLGLIDWPDP
jgi:DNA-binding NarL/FixJ family response regulator